MYHYRKYSVGVSLFIQETLDFIQDMYATNAFAEVLITFLSHFCINIFSLLFVGSSNTALLWETKNVCVQFESSVTSPIINDGY